MFRHSKLVALVDDTDPAILSNATNITLAKFFTPDTTESTAYQIYFNNGFYNPHTEHNKTAGGIIASTGFYISGDASNQMYFDDDGSGNLRLYYLVAGSRVYQDSTIGTVNYATGEIKIFGIHIATVGNVDGAASSKIRITAVPNSRDIVPVRNQLLEIDFVNTYVVAEVDTIATSDASAGSSYIPTTTYTSTSGY